MEHTKGEWMIAENGIEDKYKYTVLALGARCICDVYRHNYPKNKKAKDEEAIANAKLIEASPDLLEALKSVLKSGAINPAGKLWKTCENAIKKATLFIALLFSVSTAFSQVHLGMGAGYDAATKKPLGQLIMGATVHNVVLEGVVTYSLTKAVNVNNYFTIKAGYNVHNFIPAVGFYNDYVSADDPKLNHSFAGYSLTKIFPIYDDGRAVYASALYTKMGFQFTAGFSITLNFNND